MRPSARPAPTLTGPLPGAAANSRLIARTGHDFLHWFGVLEAFGARVKGHSAAARCRFTWDGTCVELQLVPRKDGRANAIAVHTKLPDARAVDTRRGQWRTAPTALAAHLAGCQAG